MTPTNKIKIVAFMNTYSQGRSGADVRFVEITRHWKNINITLITSQMGSYFSKELKFSGDFLITSKEKEFKNPILTYIIRTIKALLFNIKTDSYTVLYSTSDFFPDIIPAFILKNRFNKWISVIHHIYPHYKKRGGNIITNIVAFYLQKLSFYLIKKKSDKIIVVNELIKKDLLTFGFVNEKIIVSSNGINLKYINRIKVSNTKYDGIYLGRLGYSKGIFDLIKIWKNLCCKNSTARLAIIGIGNKQITKKVTKEIIVNNLQKNIYLLGYLPDNQVYSLLKTAKIFVFPSHEEGFGIAIAEAIACRLPVIAYDLPTYPMTFKKIIFNIPLYDIEKFSELINYLLNNEKKRLEMVKLAFNTIQKYTWEKIAKNELKIINQLIFKSVNL